MCIRDRIIRYTKKDKNGKLTLCEDFLKFVPVCDLKGKALANTVLDSLQELGVNINYIQGQGLDGATSVSGPFQGCAGIIREKFLQSVYIHCASLSLNLALCHSCNVPIKLV